jgi:hypothetical protein
VLVSVQRWHSHVPAISEVSERDTGKTPKRQFLFTVSSFTQNWERCVLLPVTNYVSRLPHPCTQTKSFRQYSNLTDRIFSKATVRAFLRNLVHVVDEYSWILWIEYWSSTT